MSAVRPRAGQRLSSTTERALRKRHLGSPGKLAFSHVKCVRQRPNAHGGATRSTAACGSYRSLAGATDQHERLPRNDWLEEADRVSTSIPMRARDSMPRKRSRYKNALRPLGVAACKSESTHPWAPCASGILLGTLPQHPQCMAGVKITPPGGGTQPSKSFKLAPLNPLASCISNG